VAFYRGNVREKHTMLTAFTRLVILPWKLFSLFQTSIISFMIDRWDISVDFWNSVSRWDLWTT
jgi:hypothetical protein